MSKYEEFILACSQFNAGDEDEFAGLLARALDSLALLQSDLADLCEVGPSTVSRWLSGQTRPMKRTRSAIIKDLRSRALKLQKEQLKRQQKPADRELPLALADAG